MGLAVVGDGERTGAHATEVALTRTAVDLGVGIEDLIPDPRFGDADAVSVSGYGGHVVDYKYGFPVGPESEIGDDAVR
jgi:hypothetical protein